MDHVASNPSMEKVRAQFEAMLLEPLLQPMERAFGEYGQIAEQSFAQALAKALAP
ncbi:MAG TPA: hypothetical protein VFH72_08435 [Candidatus Baltobacteraceae bacterium]|jgi:hypothetical protein|nr:hypothetical protein [Candidatus Baltobacteraceae bacterium]